MIVLYGLQAGVYRLPSVYIAFRIYQKPRINVTHILEVAVFMHVSKTFFKFR